MKPEKRSYRRLQRPEKFKSFEVIVGESDLWISVPEVFDCKLLKKEIEALVRDLRTQLNLYIGETPQFLYSLEPVEVERMAPLIAKLMAQRCRACSVGPMAGVAGAFNFFVGKRLEELGVSEFLIENGGDLYIKRNSETVVLLLLPSEEGRYALKIPSGEWGISSSSSKIGHSLSLGNTEIATVIAKDPILSDCCATYLGNSKSVEDALKRVEKLPGEVEGALVLINGKFVIKGEKAKPYLLKGA